MDGNMGEKRNECSVLLGRPERDNHIEDLVVDGRAWTGFILLREHGRNL
jgi:hypothetical protein